MTIIEAFRLLQSGGCTGLRRAAWTPGYHLTVNPKWDGVVGNATVPPSVAVVESWDATIKARDVLADDWESIDPRPEGRTDAASDYLDHL